MKYTLLDMVQTVLSSLDSDEVNSINDTTEALQVAYIIRSVYYRIASQADLPEQSGVFNLTASGPSTPVIMYRPNNVKSIEWIKYNKADTENPDPLFTYIEYLPLEDFLNMTHSFNLSNIEIESFDLTVNGSDTFKILYRSDKHPDYYTTYDDNTIIFDSYLSFYDANLQASKSLGYGLLGQAFYLTDSFIPNLDEQQFDLLLNEAKAWAHLELKQMPHPKAEQAVRHGWSTLERTKRAIGNVKNYPDYGRK